MKLERSVLINSAVLLLALGTGAALFVTRERPTTSQREARAHNLFASFPSQELLSLQVRSRHGTLELERKSTPDGGSPQYTLKGNIPADPEAAEALIRALEMGAFLRQFQVSEVDRAKFGLEPAQAELHARFARAELGLRAGKAALTPAGTTYVETTAGGETRVGLVKTETLKELFPNPDDLRPTALIPHSVSEFAAIHYRDGGLDVALHRGQGPAWLDQKNQRVRRDTVEHLLLELGTLKAESFLELGAARAALDRDGALSATFTLKASNQELGLRVGSACPSNPEKLVAERIGANPAAACVVGGLRRAFAEAAQKLADSSPFALHTDEIESLLIERNQKKLELTRSERGFSLTSPARADVALNVGNARLDALLQAEAEPVSEPDLGALGLNLPLGTVRLRSSSIEGNPRFDEVLELGRPRADGALPVRRREDGKVLLLPREAARAYVVDSTLLRPAKVLEFGPSELTSLEISWDHERELLRRGPGGSFELSEPRGLSHDGALVLELVQALGTLSTERWVADSDDGSFGFEQPRVRAKLELTPRDAGTSAITLLVGANTAGGAFAELSGSPGVFVLEKALVTRLTTLLVSRALISEELSAFARIELAHSGKTLTLLKQGSGFVAAQGSDLSPALVERAIEALRNLRAEAAVHTGPARAEEGTNTPTLTVRLTSSASGNLPRTLRFGTADTFQEQRVFHARI
ncbi:MAG TPA: DUF4340 domain-containing protein, partial [Polyangiaceae bacterium]|nr:DUF4340 domain-containing protein [Polyangiaceae bacterium]